MHWLIGITLTPIRMCSSLSLKARRAVALLVIVLPLFLLPADMAPSAAAQHSSSSAEAPAAVVVDDFERYPPGTFPDEWVFVNRAKEALTYEETRDPGEEVVVEEEDGNQFVRVITEGEAVRYTQRNGEEFEWNINEHPRLQWRWRALELPEGASEKGQNDSGGAVYVTFGSDWLGRPKSIKYTYSSSLPVGTIVSFGPLKVIVVDSANEPRFGEWKIVTRNIVNDYQQVFGGSPPDRPLSITLWGDSDTTESTSKVDFDDIKLLPAFRR